MHHYYLFLQLPFEELDPEDMTAITAKYGKSVYQLEKGLPPNGVVPQLKKRVENMKDKVPHQQMLSHRKTFKFRSIFIVLYIPLMHLMS